MLRTPYAGRPRTTFLGGSDIAAMLGLSPYKTRRDLWLEKTGQRIGLDDAGINYHLRRGQRLEKVAAQYFLEVAGGQYLKRAPKRKTGLAPWMGGSPDALWREGPRSRIELVDFKVPSAETFRTMLRSVTIDVSYQCQVWWYMGQYPAVEHGQLVVYQPDGDELLPTPVPRDEELIGQLYEQAYIFWSHVEARTVPPDAAWTPPVVPPPIPAHEGLALLPNARALDHAAAALARARKLAKDADDLVTYWRDAVTSLVTAEDGVILTGDRDVAPEQSRRGPLDREALAAAAPLDRDKVLAALQQLTSLVTAEDGVILTGDRDVAPEHPDEAPFRLRVRVQSRRGPLDREALAAAAPLDRDKVLAALQQHGLLAWAAAPWWKDCALDLEAFRPETQSIVVSTTPLKAAPPAVEHPTPVLIRGGTDA